MTIDERLEFLVQSTESLHASCQQLHAMMSEQIRRESQSRRAAAAAMLAYIKALDEGDDADTA